MRTNKLVFALIAAGLAANSFAAKPPPKAAQDVDCVECVDTGDIANGAVTTDKLSTELLQEINLLSIQLSQLQVQVNALDESLQARGPQLIVVDANQKRIGLLVNVYWQGNGVLGVDVAFSTDSHEFYIPVARSGFQRRVVVFDDWDCNGTPYVLVSDSWADEFPSMLPPANIGNNTAYVPDLANFNGVENQSFTIRSELEASGQCNNQEGTSQGKGIPAVPALDLSDYVAPFRIISVQ